jgi:hypothetical protein
MVHFMALLKKLTLPPIVFRWSFTLVLVTITAIITERSLKKVHDEGLILESQLQTLLNRRQMAIQQQNKLKQQLNSQSDPAWIEIVLKRELGLIPEGQIKVLFNPMP